MTRDMFESELKTIESSFRFQSMLEHNEDLAKRYKMDERKVLLAYHAFKSGCSEQLLDSPLTIGGYVRHALKEPDLISSIVTEARGDWGAR